MLTAPNKMLSMASTPICKYGISFSLSEKQAPIGTDHERVVLVGCEVREQSASCGVGVAKSGSNVPTSYLYDPKRPRLQMAYFC